jgi:multiple sugar transport system ATP-binding protein
MPHIALKNITKRFGDNEVVKNLSLEIGDKDFIVLLGPSGCGKTTTLRMIAGLETPTSGEITIDGNVVFSSKDGTNVPPSKRNIGFLFQNYALWPHMTAYQNIAFGLENLKWKKEDIKARVSELANLLKIGELLDRYPSELSGGQQQRVAIARTLAPNPSVLLMDEPLSNLDAKLRMEMRSELKRLHREIKSTFVYVTHDQLEAMTLATNVSLMRKGVLQQFAPPIEIYDNPSNIFVADFIGNPSMNLLKAECKNFDGKRCILKYGEKLLAFESKEFKDELSEKKELVLGLRPEDIKIGNENDSNGIKGTVHSILFSGKESVTRVKIHGDFLTVSSFGRVKFSMDEECLLEFPGEKYLLFDGESGEKVGRGRINILKETTEE